MMFLADTGQQMNSEQLEGLEDQSVVVIDSRAYQKYGLFWSATWSTELNTHKHLVEIATEQKSKIELVWGRA